jgi:hypothetical protein
MGDELTVAARALPCGDYGLLLLENEARLSKFQTLSPYLKEKSARLHYKSSWVMLFKETVAVCSGNHMKHIKHSVGRVKD